MSKKVLQGLNYSQVAKELNISYRHVQKLVNKGELKLNDDERIDEVVFKKVKEEWDRRPDWMKVKK